MSHARVLVVSNAARWSVGGLECVRFGALALAAWRERQHPFVFADLAKLADAMTGARLCTAIRLEPQGKEAVILLMADAVHTHHLAWARRCGADGVIQRSADEMLAAVARCGQPMGVPSEPAALAEVPLAEGLALVEARLQQVAHMGPVRSMVVADAWESLQRELPGGVPTLDMLFRRVADEIEDPAARAAFLRGFKEQR